MTVRIRNTKSAGGGNDLALDDIIFSPSVVTSGAHFNTNTGTKTITAPILSSVILNATTPTPSVPNINYQWEMSFNGGLFQPIAGATTVPYTYSIPNTLGTYTFRLRFASGANINSPNCRYTTDCITLSVTDPCDELCFWKLTGNNISGNRNVLGTLSNHPIRVQTQGLERMRITEGGNVGIGTNVPVQRLDVLNGNITSRLNNTTNPNSHINDISHSILSFDGGIELFRHPNNAPFGAVNGFIDFKRNATIDFDARFYYHGWLSGGTRQGLLFNIGGGDRVAILDNGNVGIGTINPNTLLHLSADLTGWLQNIKGTVTSGGEINGLRFYGGYPTEEISPGGLAQNKWAGIALVAESQHSNHNGLAFYTGNNSTAPTEKVRISNNGNVGIGIANPLNRTEINEINNPTTPSSGTIDGGNGNGASGLRFTNLTNRSPFYENDSFKPRGVLSVDE
jgi:hypothetical protein